MGTEVAGESPASIFRIEEWYLCTKVHGEHPRDCNHKILLAGFIFKVKDCQHLNSQ